MKLDTLLEANKLVREIMDLRERISRIEGAPMRSMEHPRASFSADEMEVARDAIIAMLHKEVKALEARLIAMGVELT